ncbi:hypothetical protein GCM10027287_39800 [Bordetella muralis]
MSAWTLRARRADLADQNTSFEFELTQTQASGILQFVTAYNDDCAVLADLAGKASRTRHGYACLFEQRCGKQYACARAAGQCSVL